jgi:hypothetical protein
MAEGAVRWLDDLTTLQFVVVTAALAWCVFVAVSVVFAIGLLFQQL